MSADWDLALKILLGISGLTNLLLACELRRWRRMLRTTTTVGDSYYRYRHSDGDRL